MTLPIPIKMLVNFSMYLLAKELSFGGALSVVTELLLRAYNCAVESGL